MPLAVSADESDALAFDLADSTFEIKQGDKLRVPVKVKRRIELKQALKVQTGGLPRRNGGDNNKSEMTIAADSDAGVLDLDLSQQKLTPGTYTFYLLSQAQIKYDRKDGASEKPDAAGKGKKRQAQDSLVTFYSPPITLKVLPK
jgi:hypothetical protein